MKTNTILYFKKSIFISSHNGAAPWHDNSKSKQNVSNILENRWVKCNCNSINKGINKGEKYNQSFIMQYVCAKPFCSQLRVPLPNTHTHTHTRQQLLADGMEGFYRHMLTVQKPVGSRTASEQTQRGVWALFHQSDLLCLSFIYQQPPHFYYEDFCLFIENLNTNRSSSKTAQ